MKISDNFGIKWDGILVESKLVAEGCGVVPTLKLTDTKRKRKRLLPDKTVLDDDFSQEDPVDDFKRTFLANVRLSSLCLSVMFVRPTQAVQIFRNISTALGTWAIH